MEGAPFEGGAPVQCKEDLDWRGVASRTSPCSIIIQLQTGRTSSWPLQNLPNVSPGAVWVVFLSTSPKLPKTFQNSPNLATSYAVTSSLPLLVLEASPLCVPLSLFFLFPPPYAGFAVNNYFARGCSLHVFSYCMRA